MRRLSTVVLLFFPSFTQDLYAAAMSRMYFKLLFNSMAHSSLLNVLVSESLNYSRYGSTSSCLFDQFSHSANCSMSHLLGSRRSTQCLKCHWHASGKPQSHGGRHHSHACGGWHSQDFGSHENTYDWLFDLPKLHRY